MKKITLENPANFKNEDALIAKLKKVHQTQMQVKTAIWLQNAKNVLVDKFGWNEKDACQFIAMWSPKSSAYAATA